MTINRTNGSAPRVAIVIRNLNSGGAERAALNIAAATQNCDCTVIAEYAGGDLVGDPLAKDVVTVSHALEPSGRLSRVAKLTRALRSMRAEVVVSMLSPLVDTGAAGWLGLPVIHWLQAPWSRTTAVGGTSISAIFQRQILRAACSCHAIVAAATPGLAEECAALGIPRRRLAVLPNGLELPAPFEAIRSGARRRDTVITIGRLEPQKRHDVTLQAFARLVQTRSAHLVVVGSGREEQPLRSLARDLGIADKVEFTGFVADPNDRLANADVFALSTDHEGFGNVIVEALAWGLPVVVSDVPYGPRFILEDGRYGDLVPAGDIGALAEALRRALDEGSDGGAAAARIQRAQAFSICRVAGRFDELVELVTQGSGEVSTRYLEWP
jgi:glycosyltransferase involved in cell wall biosynthesis